MSALADKEEEDHWFTVMRTLLHYEDFVGFDLGRRQQRINKLPLKYADRLPNVSYDKFQGLQHACGANQAFLDDMVQFQVESSFHARSDTQPVYPSKDGPTIPLGQQHRNIAVLHSAYREWSEDGRNERDSTFKLLVDELKLRLPVNSSNVYQQKVLVPGCGLGRLPLEIAASGYSCQGNEYSAFMAIASNFLLNGVEQAGEYRIHPWISNVCNIANVTDSMQAVVVPDVAAGELLHRFEQQLQSGALDSTTSGGSGGEQVETALVVSNSHSLLSATGRVTQFPRFSMAAGDFVEVYTNLKNTSSTGSSSGDSSSVTVPTDSVFHGMAGLDSSLLDDTGAGKWDAVVTCFFVDTAPVVLEYIEAIERMLKPGGVWVNLGPLLYHWAAAADSQEDQEVGADPRYAQSVELSYEELKQVIEGYGFEYLAERWQDCTYTRCDSAMMWTTYRTVLFTVRKPVVTCKACST